MARPIKSGIDYFTLDSDFWSNRKIAILRAEFGMMGVGLYLTILALIYGSRGYYIDWSNDDCLLVSQGAAGGCTPNQIKEVINGCLRCSLFDERVFKVFNVITSAEIQRRYLEAVGKRSRITIIKEYWLLDGNDENDVSPNTLNKVIFKSVSGGKTQVNVEKTIVNSESIPQSKSNQSKSDQSKVNHLSGVDSVADNRCPDDDLIDDDDATKEQIKKIEDFIVGRKISKNEHSTIQYLVKQYGIGSLSGGIDAAINAGGKSVSYLAKCVATAHTANRLSQKDTGRYPPTYDINEIEEMMDSEWSDGYGFDEEFLKDFMKGGE